MLARVAEKWGARVEGQGSGIEGSMGQMINIDAQVNMINGSS